MKSLFSFMERNLAGAVSFPDTVMPNECNTPSRYISPMLMGLL